MFSKYFSDENKWPNNFTRRQRRQRRFLIKKKKILNNYYVLNNILKIYAMYYFAVWELYLMY